MADAASADASPAVRTPSVAVDAAPPPDGLFVHGEVQDFVVSGGELFWITTTNPTELRARTIGGDDEHVLAIVHRRVGGFALPLAVTDRAVFWFDDDPEFDRSEVRVVPRGGGAVRTVLPGKTMPYPLVEHPNGLMVTHGVDLVALGPDGAITTRIADVNSCSYGADAATLYFTVECGRGESLAAALDGTARRPLGAHGRILGVTSEGPLLAQEKSFVVLHEGAVRDVASTVGPPVSDVRRSRKRGPDLYLLGFFPAQEAKPGDPPPRRQTLVRLRDGATTLAIVKEDLGARASFDVDGPWLYFNVAEGVRRMPLAR